MSRYLNKLNAGMFICDGYNEYGGKIAGLTGIKETLSMNSDNMVDFSFVCNVDFVEFEIPKSGGELSFRFYIRTLGGEPSYILPFFIAQLGLIKNNEGVITHRFPIMMDVKEFEFPRRGRYAIEVYKYFGMIDMKVEEENRDFYRKPENFINAIVFEVV